MRNARIEYYSEPLLKTKELLGSNGNFVFIRELWPHVNVSHPGKV